MITIFNPQETSFISDGLGVIDKIVMDCIIKHELNGAYFLELTAVIDDEKLFELIDYDNIIKANGQIFRIIDIDKDTDFIYAKALHIFYDLQNNFLEDVAPTNKNCGDALNWILQRTVYPNPFVGSSDIANLRTARYVRYSPTDAIMGRIDNSFLNVWGGEILRNNYSIEILSRLGIDTEVEISYGKNITGIEETIIKSNVVTKIMPQGFDGLLLPEKYVDSPYILSYPMPIIRKIEFRDVKVNDDPDLGPVVTESQAYDMLRDLAAKKFSVDKIDLPLVNYKVNFIDLSQTEEYKEYQVLESLSLGDSATVKHERLGITVTARVISTVWDVMRERYRAIELGNFSQNLQSYIKDVNEETKESIFIDSVQSASELIRNGLGGYTKKTREEFLIMDTTDENTAQELWRWNRNGLGWSGSGYNGVYGIALTKDGKINASMIKTGKLLAEYILADYLSAISANLGTITLGRLLSPDGTVDINISNNTFKIGQNAEHTEDYSKYLHDDGSYTMIGTSGLERVIAGIPKKYHYLTAAGAISASFSSPNYLDRGYLTIQTITLPPDFKNKDFQVLPSLGGFTCFEYYMGEEIKTPYYSLTMSEISVSIDKAAGKCTITARLHFARTRGSDPENPYKVEFKVNYMAVG